QVAGVVQQVSKRWKEKYGSERDVKFEAEVLTASGETVKLMLPNSQIGENQAAALSRKPIVALLRDNDPSDVWEFSAGTVKIVDYAVTRQKRGAILASEAENGPYVAAAGTFVLLLGAAWFYRRRATSAEAA
ncbi:MAG: hypothetical protein HY765_09420, partial [Rhodomicrobium sp.]|nr:hypothetical protein [Rhodomicrobium sp.]